MFSRFYKTKLQWRRVAVYQPVTVAGTTLANEDGSERQRILQTCHAGMRVIVCREPTKGHEPTKSHEPNTVALFVDEGRRIGHLPAEVAEWVAPLLDSGRAAFDSEIWSLEKVAGDNGQPVLICRLMLTQHELVPVRRFSWTAWLKGDGRSQASPTSEPVRTLRHRNLGARSHHGAGPRSRIELVRLGHR